MANELDPRSPEYLAAQIALEQGMLPHANEFRLGEQHYGTDRGADTGEIGQYAKPIIAEKIAQLGRPLRVLEIGGGQGEACGYLLNQFPEGSIDVTMTTLNPLPQHDALQRRGAHVVIPVVAEALPAEWSQQFDVILTSCVMGWTYMDYSIPEIGRVLASGGTWLGLESEDAYVSGTHIRVSEAILGVMERHGMRDSASRVYRYKKLHGYYPFRYDKP